ncbi:MAG TPA: TolC family protein [Gemmatimonadaceae bacterium]|nr:TolC family protein [Gemmatimonadaceae bacterium]
MTWKHTWSVLAIGLGAGLGAAAPAAAQQDTTARTTAPAPNTGRPLSLDEALRLAESQSEAVQVARAGATRAAGQQYQARSQYLPQISGIASYQRTLRSQFQGISFGGSATDTTTPPPPALCSPFIGPNATPAERQAALDQAASCPPAGRGIDFSKVGFGAPNQWTLGLQLSQNVFAGGRIVGQNQAANAAVAAAAIEVTAQRAQLVLDVTQAYYDAALADRLVAIQEAALAQTNETLRQTRVARQVGNQSEFELLRAQVTHDNQLPVVIQARGSRQVAYLRLKQLLNLPLDDSIALTTPLDDSTAIAGTVRTAAAVLGPTLVPAPGALDTAVSDRAPVRQSAANVRAQEGLLRAARGERFPAIQITSGYQRLYFPTSVFPQFDQARENWTIGVSASVPIFSGGRLHGDALVAQANLQQARAQQQQTRELAALDTRVALNALTQAAATWSASAGTAEQASRAYSIDQIRYREGISTQTDLSQSRLLLEQALANRAQAARDFAVARVRLALLRNLPLQAGAASAATQTQGQSFGGANAGASPAPGTGGAVPQQAAPPQQTTTSAAASTGGIGGITP